MKQPNILLINCDDLGYGDLACFGSSVNKTPHIDRLAADGLKLDQFYMASPVCSASRAAMMTGCYPPRIGFGWKPVLHPSEAIGLSTKETTIAKQLKTVGYRTRIIGKWHCGDQPEFLPPRHGFDGYFGLPYSNDMGRQVNADGKIPDNPPLPRPPLPLLRDEAVIQQQPDQRGITERYTDDALQFIEASAKAETPFFLYLAHMYVHVPLFVPKQFLSRSKNGAYGAAVECIDWSTGVLVDYLKQKGLFKNTLIIFTSDNGSRARDEGGSNAPLRGTKATTWEGGQRVPCILHWPEGIPGGRTCNQITRSIDFLPTLSAVAGVQEEPAHPIDGVDLSAYLTDDDAPCVNDRMVYYFSREQLEAVRIGDWKLHFHKGDTPHYALYNLKENIDEDEDLAARHPEIVTQLEAFAEEVRTEMGDSLTGVKGRANRPVGRVSNPKPLTEYSKDHPYIVAAYDLPDMPTMAG